MVEKPKIQLMEFDFQTEEYPQEIEAELQWINDRQRLNEQNISPSSDAQTYVAINEPKDNLNANEEIVKIIEPNGDNDKEEEENKPIIGKTIGNYKNDFNVKPVEKISTQSIEPIEENIKTNDNNLIISSNENKWNEAMDNSNDFTIKPNIISVDKNMISRHSLTETNLNSMPEMDINSNQLKKTSVSDLPKTGDWKKISENMEQRVIELPQTFGLPNGFHRVGEREIITDANEVVITENMEPVIKEEVLNLPDKQF